MAIALAILPVAYYILYRFVILRAIWWVERNVKTPWIRRILVDPIGPGGSPSASLNQGLRQELRDPKRRPPPPEQSQDV